MVQGIAVKGPSDLDAFKKDTSNMVAPKMNLSSCLSWVDDDRHIVGFPKLWRHPEFRLRTGSSLPKSIRPLKRTNK